MRTVIPLLARLISRDNTPTPLTESHASPWYSPSALPHLIIVLFLLSYTSMFGNISVPNERSRIYLSTALIDDGTVSIDRSLRRFGMIGDRAVFRGKHYSDKAPGSSFLGAVVYYVVRLNSPASAWKIYDLLWLMRTYVSLPFALLGWWWLRRLLESYGLSRSTVELVSVSWILGTAAFHYGGAFFGHQIASTLLVGSWLWMKRAIDQSSAPALIYSGLLSGAAVLVEYPAGIGVITIGLYGALHLTRLRARLALWVVGGLPSLALLCYYHQSCFNDPLSLPYEHLAAKVYKKIHSEGVAGVTAPEWSGFELWFLSLKRGLFSTSPFVALSLVGCVLMVKRSLKTLIPIGLFMLALTLFASGAHIWGGDWGYGPRILVFGLGLLMIPTAFAVEACTQRSLWRWVMLTLVTYSVVMTQLIHVFFPEPWSKSLNPLVDIVGPMWSEGVISPNLITIRYPEYGMWSVTPVALLVGLILFNLYRRVIGSRLIFHVSLVVLSSLATLGVTSQVESATPAIQAKWVKLVKLWSDREARYHSE